MENAKKDCKEGVKENKGMSVAHCSSGVEVGHQQVEIGSDASAQRERK